MGYQTTKEILLAGVQRIRTIGWRQGGALFSAAPATTLPMCAVQTLCESGGMPGVFAAISAVKDCLGVDDLAAWNDQPGRTVEEVIAAFEAAAAKESV